jgi:hypothetical protein
MLTSSGLLGNAAVASKDHVQQAPSLRLDTPYSRSEWEGGHTEPTMGFIHSFALGAVWRFRSGTDG